MWSVSGGQAGRRAGGQVASERSLTRSSGGGEGSEGNGSVCAATGSGRMHHRGRARPRSAVFGSLRRRMRAAPIDRRPRGAAPLKCSASRDASPGLGPQRWRRERAPPAASGGHAAMAREVTETRPAPSAASALLCNRWSLTRPETWWLSPRRSPHAPRSLTRIARRIVPRLTPRDLSLG